MKGIKNYVTKVIARHDIHGVCVKGNVYELKDLKRLFPYIDFSNREYWTETFDYKFRISDKVRYIGYIGYKNKNLSKHVTYTITKIIPEIKNELLFIYYEITDGKHTFTVTQSDIDSVEDRWIISFGQDIHTDYPGIHMLDFNAWETKIKGTWKEKFVFNDYNEAVAVAKMFAGFSLTDLLSLTAVVNSMHDFKDWLYQQDWSDSPEENHAHNCVINKFEELGLDEAF